MKRVFVLGIVLAAAGTAGCTWIAMKLHHRNRNQPYEAEPFYRKYLVAGNKLDDQILEQERRVQDRPEDPDLRNDFGNLLAQRRFVEDARMQYEKALDLDDSHYLAAYNLGILWESEGKFSKAVSA